MADRGGLPSAAAGLGSAEAAARLAAHGPNDLGSRAPRGWRRMVAAVLGEPMFLLLLAAAAVYLLLGDPAEGALLGGFACVTIGLVVVQERRSDRALEALRSLAAPQVRVLRDGVLQRLPATVLVPGDACQLDEGDRVPADAVLLEAMGLLVDESLLTGEALPVRKAVEGDDEVTHVSAGTLVVQGHALAEVVTTGQATRMGQIGASLRLIDPGPTPLQQRLRRLAWVAGGAALALSVVLALWYGLRQGEWLEGALAAIAFAMAMLPEEIPLVVAIFTALGAWRLAQQKVLVRRSAAIEALGAATVLCVDKTGTLTENRLRLRRLFAGSQQTDFPTGAALAPALQALLDQAALASRRAGADPLDQAVLDAAAAPSAGRDAWTLARDYPLTPALPAITQAWRRADGSLQVAAKGAPEAIAALCRFGPDETAALLRQVREVAADGLRVIAAAKAEATGEPPDDPRGFAFRFLGLLAFEDPLRAEAAAAVAQAREAGIRVVMVTGDHAATALAIARQAGIDTGAGALAGVDVEAMDDPALARAVAQVNVFARVLPHQKLRLVRAFRARGDTVAMTGDGVNDAPALKAAHIGIAMGVRGTDVAREAAGIVLLDENFARVVAGVRLGRRIADNLGTALTYIAAVHVPIAGLALLPVVLGLPPVLLPAHVVLTEMVIDPACSLAFESLPEQPGLMRRPPRRDSAALAWPSLVEGLCQGVALMLANLAVLFLALRAGLAFDASRALTFASLMAGNLLLVWLNSAGDDRRRLRPSGPLVGIAAFAGAILAIGLAVEPLRHLLHFAVPPAGALAGALAGAAAAVLLGDFAGRRLAALLPTGESRIPAPA